MKLSLMLVMSLFVFCQTAQAKEDDPDVSRIKRQIIDLATSYAGQGDPDYSRQRSLEVLVEKLLVTAPQPPVRDRMNLIYGTWKQVWGPYDYRRAGSRGIDPELGIDEIYQTVFPGGYYYNISPLYKDGDRSRVRIGLLRGEYGFNSDKPNQVNVHFTSYRGINGYPADRPIWQLAPLAEAGTLPDTISIVPQIIVRLFFNSGTLDEVYTDETLRITYGLSNSANDKRSIYIMTRVE